MTISSRVDIRSLGLAAAAAALVLASGQALASEPTKFDGPYIGVHGGYSFGEVRTHKSRGGEDVSLDGFRGGVHAGYGRAFIPQVYTGVEVDYGWSFSEGKGRDSQFERDHDYGAALRVGYIADSDTMLYGKAGYQRAAFEMDKERDWRGGVKVGAGVEHFVLDDVSVKAEYSYAHYFANKGRDTFKDAANSEISVGIAYHF